MATPAALKLSPDLTAALWNWASVWERVASAGIGLPVQPPLGDGEAEAVQSAGRGLAHRLAHETGAVVVSAYLGDQRSTDCPRCGTGRLEASGSTRADLRRTSRRPD